MAAEVDLTGAVTAGLQTEHVVVAGPSVAAGLQTEPPQAVAASGLLTEPLTVGSTIFVDLPEHGISADFTVREIRPCPTPMAGDGYLVTTKFIHENAEILDLRIEGSGEPIGTTASHPFWSEDRQQFVAAGELRIGENLLLADDTTRRVESITLRPIRETVYNIEVDGEHVFYVGNDGVLVHNSCRKYVYVIKDAAGKTVYVGITNNLAIRKAAHILSGTLRKGDEMFAITNKIKHGAARTLESKLLHNALKEAGAKGLFKNYHQIWYQLKQAGLRNSNRGRLSDRWVRSDVFQHIIPDQLVK